MYNPDLVITIDNRHTVIGALVNAGHAASELHAMTNVGLSNFYHACQPDTMPEPTGMQRLAAEIVGEAVKALGGQRLDEDLVRYLARNEAQTLVDAMRIPRELIVTSPVGTVHLTGLVHYMTPAVIETLALTDHALMVGPAGCG